METNHPFLWRLAWFTGLGVLFTAILALPERLFWLESCLLMFWATLFVLIFVRTLLFSGDALAAASLLMFFVGCFLMAAFFIWLGNSVLKVVVNSVAVLMDSQFKLGNLFPGAWNYVLSFPALICGLVLVDIGILWNCDIKYHLLKASIMFFQRID